MSVAYGAAVCENEVMDDVCGQSTVDAAKPVRGSHAIRKHSTNLTVHLTILLSGPG